ncbi:hypothetical protein IKW75_01135 [Candidatus Saccharibacteria bacterium]|nr:hypothetical protein [Candidatus Saccharibacteria bacterium]
MVLSSAHVKKAKSLNSLDELDDAIISKRTRNCLMKKVGNIERIVWMGRLAAYHNTVIPIMRSSERILFSSDDPAWQRELALALDQAGFIRSASELNEWFKTGALYDAIYGPNTGAITNITQIGNERYESFELLSSSQMQLVYNAIGRADMSPCHYRVIGFHYGFNPDGDMRMHTVTETARFFETTVKRVRRIERRTFERLRESCELPAFFGPRSELDRDVNFLIDELDELKERQKSLLYELSTFSKMPIETVSKTAQKYIDRY